MSKPPVKTDAMIWSGSARRLPPEKAGRGVVEGLGIGIADAAARPEKTGESRREGSSAFTEKPSVAVDPFEREAERSLRPNGRVKLNRY